ncbi:MAG TPA: PilZ domain-containing protein [Bryobacteraceae bacterium]|nr:PilZ domain-containing protein [Bryobacteraceae bacterium]
MATAIQLDSTLCDIPDTTLNTPVRIRLVAKEDEVSAQLARVDRGFLKLSTSAALPTDSQIELVIDGCTIRAQVLSCEQEQQGKFALAVRRVYGPHGAVRSEPRIPVDLSAVLRYPGCDHLFARIVDMSQSGLGFELPAAVSAGTRVSVHFVCGIAFGEIRHCGKISAVYRAGMRIDEFVVRPKFTNFPGDDTRPPRRGRAGFDLARPLLAVGRGILCSIAGHEYGWFTDLWERAVLRCSRCEKVLSP